MEYTIANGGNMPSSGAVCTPIHQNPLSGPIQFFDPQHWGNSRPSPPTSGSSIPPSQHTSESYNNKQQFPLMQMNGKKVLGPPKGWQGAPPSSACELFVRRIPKSVDEHSLIAAFVRFGNIYEIRFPMDFNQAHRGYAYIKFTTEEEASCAMEVLNHFFIAPQRKLEILHSYEKCSLFISNIPRHLEESEIEEKLRSVFPTMQRIYTRGSPLRQSVASNSQLGDVSASISTYSNKGYSEWQTSGIKSKPHPPKNRGHVFVNFATHVDALEAKKNTTPGVIRMWDRDLKVVWANTDKDNDAAKATRRTLFVRNVDMSLNYRDILEFLDGYVSRQEIHKISRVRSTAFFSFRTRETAESCLNQLQGATLKGKRLDIEWAKPSEQQSLHRMCKIDFDAMLRLKCIANNWQIPVIIFGTYYEAEGIQYGAVMIRNTFGMTRAIFCILQPHELFDIHSRMCEVACVLIETIGSFPDYNYLFYIDNDQANLLGMITHNSQSVDFIAAHGVPQKSAFNLNEVIDLSCAVCMLASYNEDVLLQAYKESFCAGTVATYLHNWVVCGNRVFGTIPPKYRNKPRLNFSLNDTQIVLVLCYAQTGTNCGAPMRSHITWSAALFDIGSKEIPYISLNLLPIAVTQSRYAVQYTLSHIQFGGTDYFHPKQRLGNPPLVTGCSYSQSIKEPQIMNMQIPQHEQHMQNIYQQHSQQNMDPKIYSADTGINSATNSPLMFNVPF